MNSASMATNLVGRKVRLHEPHAGLKSDTGEIATVYIDQQGIHYVLLVAGQLIPAEAAQFQVTDAS